MRPTLRTYHAALLVSATLLMSSCGGGSGTQSTQAVSSHAAITAGVANAVAPIGSFSISADDLGGLAGISFLVQAKPGAMAQPVSVSYSRAALENRGYLAPNGTSAQVPLFGLYAGYSNRVHVTLTFSDGSTDEQELTVATAAYSDPAGIYDHLTVIQKLTSGSSLGFSYFAIKSLPEGPVVVDVDGEVRWVGTGASSGGASIFTDNGFVIGSTTSAMLTRLELDGSSQVLLSPGTAIADFHHNIDPGKLGLLTEVDLNGSPSKILESTLLEVDSTGAPISSWSLGTLIAAYMRSQGDDPSTFVRDGTDWFHMNAALYDPSDDSVVVSSRENFVIKIDYATGAIRWILGDPSKYWYTFPSLRAKALQLPPGGFYPIGQHAVSLTSDGLLLLFNDGAASLNQPAGAPAGTSMSYSAVSAYRIDTAGMTATEAWRFDNGQAILSKFCSSAYEVAGHSLLVDYALADNGAHARLIGVDPAHNKVFEFQYPTTGCNSAWNSIPVPFENLKFVR